MTDVTAYSIALSAYNSHIFSEYIAQACIWLRFLYSFMLHTANMVTKVTSLDQKKQKFRTLAEKRVNKALDSIRLVGNLSNTQTYAYEDPQVRKIVKALRDAVGEMESRFSRNSSQGGDFRL